jgi:hypothetical protein
MWKNAALSLMFACLLAAGCQSERVLEKMRPLEAVPGIGLLDPLNGPFRVTETENGPSIDFAEPMKVHLAEPCRVHRWPVRFRVPGHAMSVAEDTVAVTGRLPTGKEYRVLIDTGYPGPLSVTGDIVLENCLPILPVPSMGKPWAGLCVLPSLRIGDMNICNAPCEYEEEYWVVKGFARRAYKESRINMGLMALQGFNYILCDNGTQEVEFSPPGTSFQPEDWDAWSRYRMLIEPDEQNVPRLVVDIPIGGEVRHIMLDTGSSFQLLVSSTVWETLSKTLDTGEPKAVQCALWGYRPVQCQRFNARELPVGNKTIKNAEAVVLPDGWRTGAHFAMLGVGCFENDIIVLDFGRGFLWVKDRPAASK